MTSTCNPGPTPRSTQDSVQHQYYQVPCCKCGKTHYQQQTIVTGSIHKPRPPCTCRRNVCTCGLVTRKGNTNAGDAPNQPAPHNCSCHVPKVDAAVGEPAKRNGLDYDAHGHRKRLYCDGCGTFLDEMPSSDTTNNHVRKLEFGDGIDNLGTEFLHTSGSVSQRHSNVSKGPIVAEQQSYSGLSSNQQEGIYDYKIPTRDGHTNRSHQTVDGVSLCKCKVPTRDIQTNRSNQTIPAPDRIMASESFMQKGGGAAYKMGCKGHVCCPCEQPGAPKSATTPSRRGSDMYTDASSSTTYICSCSPTCVNPSCTNYKSETAAQTYPPTQSQGFEPMQPQGRSTTGGPDNSRCRASQTGSLATTTVGSRRPSLGRESKSREDGRVSTSKPSSQHENFGQQPDKAVQAPAGQTPCGFQGCHDPNCPACLFFKHVINCDTSNCFQIHTGKEHQKKQKKGWRCCKIFQKKDKHKK